MDESHYIVATEDGSNSIFSKKFGVAYHSLYGAVEESMHVFLSAGVSKVCESGKRNIKILECGFGTGLNALLSYQSTYHFQDLKIRYRAVEAYPIPLHLVKRLNYPEYLKRPELIPIFDRLHNCQWEKEIQFNPYFYFEKNLMHFEDITYMSQFDLIFYDAFAPKQQDNLWQDEMMQKLYNSMKPQAILCTYCAKGSFKRALKRAGFVVEALPGPTRKREITRAYKEPVPK